MKLKNATERQIYAAAYVRVFEDTRQRGITESDRKSAEEEQRDIVEFFEASCAAEAIDDANAMVRLHRKGLREWRHD